MTRLTAGLRDWGRRIARLHRGRIVAVASLLAAPIGAVAHHSISGVYDGGHQVTIEGRIVEFLFVNPHPVLIVDVESGTLQHWRLEMDNRSELVEIGIDAETFKAGDRVIASGSAARNETRSLYLMKLDRPADGLLYQQIGTSPHISFKNR